MVTCGHQLGSSDDSSWLLSSSAAAPVGGNSNAAVLLHSIMADALYDPPLEGHTHRSSTKLGPNTCDFFQSQRIQLSVAKEREGKYLQHREGRVALRRSKIDSFHDFSEFDETEHLDGCPVKWLFRRQSTESWRSTGSRFQEGEDTQGGKKAVLRDKIPREMQIRKIGLKNRQGRKNKKGQLKGDIKKRKECDTEEDKDKEDWKELIDNEEKRVKLATKLNFRPFDLGSDDESEEEINLRNCLQPRPLTAQRPWLYVLLAPRMESCCSVVPQRRQHIIPDRTRSPIMSVRSLILPEIAQPRPMTTPLSSSAGRWAGQKKAPKVSQDQKKYEAPTLLTIKLQEEISPSVSEPPVNPLLEEDRYFRLRRFLNLEGNVAKVQKESCEEETRVKKVRKNRSKSCSKEAMQIVSSRVQFFERPGKPMR